MHPEIAKTLITQHHDELMRHRGTAHPAGRRRFPRWHVSWTRTVLAPAGGPGPAVGRRVGQAGRRGSSLVIIISAYRSA
jgi:hypothetical protein